jgi:hypothetical protein
MGVMRRLKDVAATAYKAIEDSGTMTPEKLAKLTPAYVEIVGIAPQDSFGVQVTYGRPLNLMARTSTHTNIQRTTGGDEMPCADGKDRVRMHGGSYLVISYRDRPAYAQGRQRWAAYQSTVLKAELAREIHPRGTAARGQLRRRPRQAHDQQGRRRRGLLRSGHLERAGVRPAALLLATRGLAVGTPRAVTSENETVCAAFQATAAAHADAVALRTKGGE